jgi:hypothetical protein
MSSRTINLALIFQALRPDICSVVRVPHTFACLTKSTDNEKHHANE